jgi:hypothetical protein
VEIGGLQPKTKHLQATQELSAKIFQASAEYLKINELGFVLGV